MMHGAKGKGKVGGYGGQQHHKAGGGGGGWHGGGGADDWEAKHEEMQRVVADGVAQFMQFETEWDADKMQKKIYEYHKKAGKNLNFKGAALGALIDEYADNMFSSMFASLGDREWLYNGQADFVHILDAGVKELFPAHTLRQASPEDFQSLVMAAHDRAFEEQRFGPILTESVNNTVQGPKIRKKVWNAVDASRKEAAYSGAQGVEDFTTNWIHSAVAQLSAVTGGEPDSVISAEDMTTLFHQIIAGGGTPLALTSDQGPPPEGWPLVDQAVQEAFGAHGGNGVPQDAWAQAPAAKRKKGGKGGW
jgi:hypothetical protein